MATDPKSIPTISPVPVTFFQKRAFSFTGFLRENNLEVTNEFPNLNRKEIENKSFKECLNVLRNLFKFVQTQNKIKNEKQDFYTRNFSNIVAEYGICKSKF